MPKPGGTVARGYGPAHKRSRRDWAPLVERGGVVCARYNCGREIIPGQLWDVGHIDPGSAGGPEHSYCNRAAGGRNAGRNRRFRAAFGVVPVPVVDGPVRVVFGPLSR